MVNGVVLFTTPKIKTSPMHFTKVTEQVAFARYLVAFHCHIPLLFHAISPLCLDFIAI
jgi:hypothetical protein